jgi:hypothetical protein
MPLTIAAINALTDWWDRGQAAPTLPANWYYTLLSAVPGPGLPNGTEITAGGVTRQAVARSLAAMSGTQGAGSTAASSGTTSPGETSNNAAVTFVASASATVSGAVAIGKFDASSGGACWEWEYITSSGVPVTRNWAAGEAVVLPADAGIWRKS